MAHPDMIFVKLLAQIKKLVKNTATGWKNSYPSCPKELT